MSLRKSKQRWANGNSITHRQLTESVWNKATQRADTHIVDNFGRADGQFFPDHHDPPRPAPPPHLEHQADNLEARGERPEGEAAHASLQEVREPGGDGIGERSRLPGDENRLVEEAAIGSDKRYRLLGQP